MYTPGTASWVYRPPVQKCRASHSKRQPRNHTTASRCLGAPASLPLQASAPRELAARQTLHFQHANSTEMRVECQTKQPWESDGVHLAADAGGGC
jgi:hypothetical protein